MKIEKFCIGTFGENTYVVYDEISKETFVVDPGKDIDVVIEYIKNNGLKLKYILITHAHIDHIEGVEPINRILGGKILLHKDDFQALQDKNISLAYVLLEPFDKFKNYSSIEDEEDFKIGDLEIKIIHTPGHTKGGVCILIEKSLFSGDTLFRESIGRTDFPGGNFEQIIKSIKEKILVLDKNIDIYPGHGENTTVQHEIESNYYVNGNMFEE